MLTIGLAARLLSFFDGHQNTMTVYRVLPEYHTVRDEATTGGYRFAHAHDVELNELER